MTFIQRCGVTTQTAIRAPQKCRVTTQTTGQTHTVSSPKRFSRTKGYSQLPDVPFRIPNLPTNDKLMTTPNAKGLKRSGAASDLLKSQNKISEKPLNRRRSAPESVGVPITRECTNLKRKAADDDCGKPIPKHTCMESAVREHTVDLLRRAFTAQNVNLDLHADMLQNLENHTAKLSKKIEQHAYDQLGNNPMKYRSRGRRLYSNISDLNNTNLYSSILTSHIKVCF